MSAQVCNQRKHIAQIVHGASGNNSKNRRRAFSMRFIGDDVRFLDRGGETSPPFNGINLKVVGNNSENRVLDTELVKLICRSKIVVNLSKTTWGKIMIHGEATALVAIARQLPLPAMGNGCDRAPTKRQRGRDRHVT